MGTFTNILVILLLIVAILQLSLNIYLDVLTRKENQALINLQRTFENVQCDFLNQKEHFIATLKIRDERIQTLCKHNQDLEDELIELKKNY